MINGLQGIPGSGKSYEAAVFQVLEALKQGRKVITNLPLVVDAYAAIDPGYLALIELRYGAAPVRGVWNPEAIDLETGKGEAFSIFEDGRVEAAASSSRTFGTVWCYWSDWRHPKTGKGPLFVIDECHVAMPKLGTDKAVVEWYKLHRHFAGTDVLLATQNFRQMSLDIAELMAMLIKVRKADILGKSDEYIRKVHAGYRGAVIQESVRKYEPHFFTLYKSHTQGSAVLESGATDVAPLSRRIKRWTRLSWGITAVGIATAMWVNSGEKKVKNNAPGFKSAVVKEDGKTDYAALNAALEPPRSADAAAPPGHKETPAERVAPEANPEPYAGKTMHLTGRMRMGGKEVATFVVSSGGARVADLTSAELVRVGYTWQALTDCAGYLRWGNSVKAITCDAPRVAAGTSEKPVVLYDGIGPGQRPNSGADLSSAKAPALVSM